MKKPLKVVLAVAAAVLLFAIGGFVAYKVFAPDADKSGSLSVANLTIDTSQKNIDKGKEKLAQRQVFYAGIPDGALSADSPILLKNPESNEDIYLQYTVTDSDTGKVIYETDLIESSNAVEWVPGSVLEPGEYHLKFTEQPYYQVDNSGWIPLTTGNNSVTIQVLE